MFSADQISPLHTVANPAAPVIPARIPRRRLQRLSNSFFKLLYRWTHSRALRHNERLWHGVSLERDARGYIAGMTIGKRSLRLANADHLPLPSTTCHLIASGPSVNAIDYDALALRGVLGVNGAIALQDRHRVRFDYYCIVDSGFVRKRPDLVARIVQEPLVLFTTPLVLWHIAQCFALERMRCRIFLIEDVLRPVRRRALSMRELFTAQQSTELVMFDESRALGFSLNIKRGAFDSRTVAYTGLQVLTSLGFEEIFLHGVDLCDTAHTPRFYETHADMQPTALDQHFASFIEPSFRHASALLKQRGVRVRNLSPASALSADIFEKVDWHTLL
jgi:Kdo-III transferase WaaZ